MEPFERRRIDTLVLSGKRRKAQARLNYRVSAAWPHCENERAGRQVYLGPRKERNGPPWEKKRDKPSSDAQ